MRKNPRENRFVFAVKNKHTGKKIVTGFNKVKKLIGKDSMRILMNQRYFANGRLNIRSI